MALTLKSTHTVPAIVKTLVHFKGKDYLNPLLLWVYTIQCKGFLDNVDNLKNPLVN